MIPPANQTKMVRLTPSEIANAEVNMRGVKYTIIRRPQPDGKQLIAAVAVDSGKIMWSEMAEDRADVRRAVRECNRWMDKMGMGGQMSDLSRHHRKTPHWAGNTHKGAS